MKITKKHSKVGYTREKHEIFWIFFLPWNTLIFFSKDNKPIVCGLDHSDFQPFMHSWEHNLLAAYTYVCLHTCTPELDSLCLTSCTLITMWQVRYQRKIKRIHDRSWVIIYSDIHTGNGTLCVGIHVSSLHIYPSSFSTMYVIYNKIWYTNGLALKLWVLIGWLSFGITVHYVWEIYMYVIMVIYTCVLHYVLCMSVHLLLLKSSIMLCSFKTVP